MPRISVILAAYNAEQFLQRCLDSLSAQSFQDFEVVIIDDGSTDKTAQIAEKHAQKDSRFFVVHQANHGVAAARQAGLDRVNGEYVIHADADDWLEPEMLKELNTCALETGADMVICDFLLHRSETRTELWEHVFPSLDAKTVLGEMLYNHLGTLWNKLVRLSCIRSFGIGFDSGLKACEDQVFVLKFLAHDVTIAQVYKPLYHYDTSVNANSFSNKGIHIEQRMAVMKTIADYTDISSFRDYYDNALLHLAYDCILRPDLCDNFKIIFFPYKNALKSASGLPLHVKILVLAQLAGFSLPGKLLRAKKKILKQ